MNILDLISQQNKAYVLATNIKLGTVIPVELLIKQLTAGNDPHEIVRLIVKTHKEINKPEQPDKTDPEISRGPLSNFKKFVDWIKNKKIN
jgi:hypothetical protein